MSRQTKIPPSTDLIVSRRHFRRLYVNRIAWDNEVEFRTYHHRERQAIRRLIRELANGYPWKM